MRRRHSFRFRKASYLLALASIGSLISFDATRAASDAAATPPPTSTPIKHVIVLIGENRSFDHLFGTYVPQSNDTILNLLSEGIVSADGSPGPQFARAKQFTTGAQATYFIGVNSNNKTAYVTLPAPTLGSAPNTVSTTAPPFNPIDFPPPVLASIEPSLEANDLFLLTTGATGEPSTTGPDARITGDLSLPNGPFQLTGKNLPYDSYTGDTEHGFYQMWQQSDCSVSSITKDNPSGCLNDLYPFVTTTYAGPTDNGGGTPMAFYNMQEEDAPLLKRLADEYTINDNYHQPAQGPTGIQHAFLGTGDDVFWSDGQGNPAVPPAAIIANPNPQNGTNNQYTLDGTFSNCSDTFNAPGVLPIVLYLGHLPYGAQAHCDPDHYYMISNINPGFLPNGVVDTQGIASGQSIPPSTVRTIGDALNEKSISWAYYGGAYNAAVNLANGLNDPVGLAYCNICNFESYASSIMGDPTQRALHIKDATDFFAAVQNGTLPAVSFVKPDVLLDGHPATSKVDLFEGMLQTTLDALQADPTLQADTALLITMDEGGGYYDSGFTQPVDFFGDGPRVPMIAVSPYTKGGHVVHSYADHVSILKFIEANWNLTPLSGRSRDNLPNPKSDSNNPYVPTNAPAISDLFDMFGFQRPQ